MSCCTLVYAAPSMNQESHLLDALLASCQKSAFNAPLPSFGRTLKPYIFDDLPGKKEIAKKDKKAAKAKTLPPPVVRAAIDSAKATQIPEKKVSTKKPTTAPKAKPTSLEDVLAWAGPGFCVAPPPDQLPAPTSFLLG